MDIFYFCESRTRGHFVSEVFLIKKRVDVFYKWLSVFFATRVGHTYLQIGKAIYSLKKLKTKNGYVQLEKIKTKNIEKIKMAMYNYK